MYECVCNDNVIVSVFWVLFSFGFGFVIIFVVRVRVVVVGWLAVIPCVSVVYCMSPLSNVNKSQK